jgi:hypothetical protein
MEFFKKERSQSIVWGLRMPIEVRSRWKVISGLMGVPCNRLILFILKDWANKNQNLLLSEELRARLASIINKAYINGRLME